MAHGQVAPRTAQKTSRVVIVSHRHRFIFFAVPRTASHAIRAALGPFLGDEDWQQEALRLGVSSPIPALARIGHGHVTVRQARSSLPPAVWRSYFKFALVRNPFDRYVSVCAMLNKRNPGYVGSERTFMKRALGVSRFQRRVLVRPQAELLADDGGCVALDFVGRYEELPSCFVEACRRVGIAEAPLGVDNAADHRPWIDYYDDELARAVAAFYARDFALFDYPPTLPCA